MNTRYKFSIFPVKSQPAVKPPPQWSRRPSLLSFRTADATPKETQVTLALSHQRGQQQQRGRRRSKPPPETDVLVRVRCGGRGEDFVGFDHGSGHVDDIAVAGAGAKFGGAAQPLRQAPENRPGTGPDASPPRKSSQQSATQPPPTQHVEEEQEVLQLSSTRLPAEVPTAECQKQQ